VCCPLAFLPYELRPQKCKSLGLYSETPSCKTATNLTHNGCSVQSQALECLNCPHTLPLFSIVVLFTDKGIYLNQACSGFKPELSVRFRTWTWKARKPSPALALFPSFHLLLWWERHRQRINYLICACFCNRVSFCCHVFTSNNLVNFNNQITAMSESSCTFD
jgi:hypothetical protein